MFSLRVLPLLLAVGLAAGCKSNSQPAAYKGEGRLLADGPAREVVTAPGGGAVAWLADPQLASDKGVNTSNQVYVGKVRMAPTSGGPAITLGDGVATLPGTFFFSPDGGKLGALTAWSFPKQHGTLVVADVARGESRKVADEVSFFAFSPDGRQLGYVADRKLSVELAAGGAPVAIAPNASTFEFSPDGKSLLVRRRAIGGGGELLLVDLAKPDQAQALADDVADYRWAEDGKRLAFTARNDKGGTDLYVVEPGSKPAKVGEGVPTFRFSPDGRHLAFIGDVTIQKQFGDLYVLPAGVAKPVKIGTTVTDFTFAPTSKRIGWLDKYSPQSRGGNLSWAELSEKPEAREVAKNVPSFVWSHGGDALAFAARQTTPVFSIDLDLYRIGKDEKPVRVGRGVFGYSFSGKDDRLFFRTECTRNARSCDLHAVSVEKPSEPARKIATGIFTYEPDPHDESMLMITYARTDADALDVAAVPADGSAGPKTLDRMVAHGTRFVGGEGDQIAYAVLDQKRLGVYVAEPPAFEKPVAAQQK
ncbi:TolB family protein [Vulgatibacter sp.]|uniref:TolB family protein n=1 Tax=Vulgatibacter sp. TaxID=1971226 RepID=UPI003567D580